MSGQVYVMKGPQSNSLLVYLMALFIVLAFLLALTLVVTAAPFSDPSDTLHANAAILRDTFGGVRTQCLVDDRISMQETCLNSYHTGNLFKVPVEP